MTRWAILTGEYPPQPGGVSDYTRLVARGLAAAGDAVWVYAPAAAGPDPRDPGVEVRRLPGRFGPASLAALDRSLLRRPRPHRILVQYVPHAFGWKAMNLPFAAWVAARARRVAPVWVMFHEVAFPFSWRPARHAVLGAATRVMARLVAGVADRVLVSTPVWGELLERLQPRVKPPEWLPVPCTIATEASPAGVRLAPPGGFVVGHFGTFGGAIAGLLAATAGGILNLVPTAALLLVGRGSEVFRDGFVAAHPGLASRVAATGALPGEAVSAHLRACDLLVQPYPDGVTSRRTSVMAGLANGLPVVTNLGTLSEPLWAGGGVALVPSPDAGAVTRAAVELLADPAARAELGRRAAALYRDTFALEHTIAKLRDDR